ncbi:MAG: hypothetical protein AAF830_06965 [Pseudomonadota bacterium]
MSDRRVFSPTQLAQLSRCEQQMLFDERFGVKRSDAWRKRSQEGTAEHAKVHAHVTKPASGGVPVWAWLALAAGVLALVWIFFR